MRRLHLFSLLVIIIQSTVTFAQDFTDSNLPIIIINTDINPATNQPYEIPDDPRVLASMKIIKHADGTRNYVTDQNTPAFLDYNGRINIEIRGSTSQLLPKKPYGLTTLQDNNTSNNNVSLLGMPSENDWILNALAYDPSLIRDYLSYNLSRQMGNYAPRTAFCELVVNGDYKGLYVFQEKIKADTNRVNVVKITASDNSVPNITGGYITKADKTTGDDPVAWTMSSYSGTTNFIHDLPKPELVTAAQDTYIHNQFTNLAVSSHANNTSIINGFPAVIDMPTFVDYMISSELASNADSYQLSTYFHKDRNGKLRAGPIWDYNLTYGNDLFDFGLDRSHYDVWQFDNGDNEGSKFWKDLFNNPTFKCYLSRRWNELTWTDQPLKHNNLVAFIENTVSDIAEASEREQERWGTVPNLSAEILNLETWLYQRINWMTDNIGPFTDCNAVATPALVINKINYNPGTSTAFPVSNDQEFIEIKNAGTATIDLTGVYFSALGISYQFPANTAVNGGQTIFLASKPAVFEAQWGIAAFGQFTRNLSNSSQLLRLSDAYGNVIDSVEYLDAAPWPDADGNGSYLQLIDPSFDNSLAASWTASSNALSAAAFNLEPTITLYPNPVSSLLTIKSESNVDKVEVFDVSGKMLQMVPLNSNSTDIDFSSYSRGMYFVKVSSRNGSKIQKIVRQ